MKASLVAKCLASDSGYILLNVFGVISRTLGCGGMKEISVEDPKNLRVWVNVYMEDRGYGGPEEGGWYYTHRECLLAVPCTLDTVPEVLSRLQEEYSNEGRRSINSVLSEGVYRVYCEAKAKASESMGKPCYE